MAKKKRYPKRPSKKSNISVWKRWEKRCAEIKKHNDKIDSERKQKQAISDKYR